jgi:hypothetical protein
MTRLTDEQLMAYADGELLGGESEIAERVRAGLSAEEKGALDDFRRTRELVHMAFADDATEAPPTSLVAMIMNYSSEATEPEPLQQRRAESPAAGVIPLKRRRTQSPAAIRTGLAMAASLALLFGIVFLWSQPRNDNEIATDLTPGRISVSSELAKVLEARRSGEPVPISHPSNLQKHLMVAATFRDRNARICREIEVLDADLVPQLAAVACRSSESGTWRVEGTAAIARNTGGDDASYAPAGASEKDALEALMSLLGAKEALKPDEERALIEKGWK